jgi:transposase
MGARIAIRKQEGIKVKLSINEPVKKIAKEYNVGEKTVYKYSKNMRHYGTLMRPKGPLQGRPSKISPEMEQVSFFKLFTCG